MALSIKTSFEVAYKSGTWLNAPQMEEQDSLCPLQKHKIFPLGKVLVHPGSEKELLVELEHTHVAR